MKETQNEKKQLKGVKVLKAILNVVINILIVVVLITSLLIAVMALTSKANGVSTIFGHTIQPIQTDSMKGGSPDGYKGGDFEHGDLMIARAVNPDENHTYELGDIVTFTTQNSDGSIMLIVHRIVDVFKNTDGTYRYQTQGDNREMSQIPDQDDPIHYLHDYDIVSVFHTKDYDGKILKGVGSILDYLRTQQGFFLVVLLPMIIFFMYALIRVVLSATGYKKTKAEEMKQEAVDAAVAAALAEKEAENTANATAPANAPAEMTPEQMEQFKQFLEFQKQQNRQKADDTPDPPQE